jgi:hypothetical protein
LGDGVSHERDAGAGVVEDRKEQDEGDQDGGEFEEGAHAWVSSIIAG